MNNAVPTLIKRFLTYKITIQSCSQLTADEYKIDLIIFFKFIIAYSNDTDMDSVILSDDNVNVELLNSIQPDHIYAFLLYLTTERNNSPETRARKLSAIKSFYKYHTTKNKILEHNPVNNIDSPRIKQKLPKFLSLQESITLLETVAETSSYPERDYCILTLFLNCGMRLSELVGINLSDIDQDITMLRVIGKGSKMRIIYLNDACTSAINNYLEVRQLKASKNSRPLAEDSKDALFLSSRNQRISNKTVQWLVKKYLTQSGLGSMGYSTHKLRHTAATLMYNNGNVDIRALKDILGHEQLNTTQIYTHVSDKKLQEAMKANPLAKIKNKK